MSGGIDVFREADTKEHASDYSSGACFYEAEARLDEDIWKIQKDINTYKSE